MKSTGFLTLFLALTSFSAFAKQTSTECTFKNNSKNKIYIDFNFNGNSLDRAKTLLLIQTQSGVKDFTYYNYAFMVDAMNYREYIPYGRRAEVVNFVDQLEQTGRFSFSIVNYGASTASLVLNAEPKSKKNLNPIAGKKTIGFEAKLKTIIKTNNVSGLENGTELTENDVSCIQRIF